MDLSKAKGLYVGNTPVKYAWFNGRRVWPQGVGNDEVGLLLTGNTYVPYVEVVKGTRTITKDEVVGITFRDELNCFIMAPENVGPFYFCGANILKELPEGLPPDNLTGPQIVTNSEYGHGKEYTDILYPYLSGAPEWAVPQTKSYVFKDGTPGYLGSPYEYGKIQRHYDEINEMAAKVGLDELFPGDFSHRYWTSVLCPFNGDTRWVWIWSGPSYVDGGHGQGQFHIRPLGEFMTAEDEEKIRESLVLWYDIKKQQATNEGMAATPMLRDLSGNGHDATCYNFAWSGMSGIGGYVQSNFNIRANNSSVFDVSVQGNIVTYQKNNGTVIGANALILYDSGTNWDRDIETKVKAGKYGLNVYATEPMGANPKNILSLPPYETGSFTYAQSDYDDGKTAIMFGNTIEVPVGEAGSFEFLPEYPDALVSDGVDDYAKATGLPILTKEKGYTVIAKRDYIDLEGIVHNSVFLDKTGFEIETCLFKETAKFNTYSFGGRNILDGFTNELLVQTSKKYGQTDISTGTLADDSILDIFKNIGDSWNGRIALYSLLLFDRDLTDNEIEWVKKNMVEQKENTEDWYGVEFYTTSPYPDCIRIGNMDLHRSLPVQSQMKGCLLSDDGVVNKYLNEADWTSETRDGSQGQVMVEMPKQSYWKFETEGNIRRVKFSTKPLPGFTKTPQGYVSAYEATMQRSTWKLASVANTDRDYRGGENDSEYDGTYRSLLGRPLSGLSLIRFRDYARNRKSESTEWNCYVYDMHKLLYWLFVVEYATLNSQKAFNPRKDGRGYAQGGLGNGVTNLDYNKLYAFNNFDPFIPCGYTDTLGNGTGQVGFTMPPEYDASGETNYAGEYSPDTAYTDGQYVTQGEDLYECIADAVAGTAITDTAYFTKHNRTVTYVNRYRGIENPFGHIIKMMDGINFYFGGDVEEGGDGLSKVYVCHDPSLFSSDGCDGYDYVGNASQSTDNDEGEAVKEVIFGEGGEIIASVKVKRKYAQYFCDTQAVNTSIATIWAVSVPEGSFGGDEIGMVALNNFLPQYNINTGSRLCFIPEQKNKSL